MIECVLDSSIVARWFLGEDQDPLARSARTFRSEVRAGALLLHAPELMIVEVANALWKQVRFAGLVPHDAERSMIELLALDMTLYRDADCATSALAIAISHGITAYDATYVHVAKNGGLPLWTFDHRLARAVTGLIDVRIPAVA
jgi:predicted nucleic acid-binding protein